MKSLATIGMGIRMGLLRPHRYKVPFPPPAGEPEMPMGAPPDSPMEEATAPSPDDPTDATTVPQ